MERKRSSDDRNLTQPFNVHRSIINGRRCTSLNSCDDPVWRSKISWLQGVGVIWDKDPSCVFFEITETGSSLVHSRAKSLLVDRIQTSQVEDPELVKNMAKVRDGDTGEFSLDTQVY